MGNIKVMKTSNEPHYLDDAEYIMRIRRGVLAMIKPKTYIVGTFGIVEDCGFRNLISWRVDGWRKDREAMLKEEKKIYDHTSKWARRQYEDMFRGW